MLQRVKKVNYVEGYKLKLVFSDNTIKIVDFEKWIREGKGYFIQLKDIEYFKKVCIDDCQYTICWPNGADFCPDVLYEVGKEVQQTRTKSKKKPSLSKGKQSTSIAAKSKRS